VGLCRSPRLRVDGFEAIGTSSASIAAAADIERLVAAVDGPVNVLGDPGVPAVPELRRLGVARVSVGSGPMHATLGHLRDVCTEPHDGGSYTLLADAVPYAEMNELLTASLTRRSR
jgi:2-methylisocitrate lyase-like PEP mutase family enzyme